MPPQINIKELHNIQKKKEQVKSVAYDRIVELIHRRIKMIATFGGSNTFYEIPGLVVGYPLYNLVDCTNYILKALRENGMLVQLLPPPHISVIYLSWDKKDINTVNAPEKPRIMPSLYGNSKIQASGRHSLKTISEEPSELFKKKQLRLF